MRGGGFFSTTSYQLLLHETYVLFRPSGLKLNRTIMELILILNKCPRGRTISNGAYRTSGWRCSLVETLLCPVR
jgi:hypothetical protein